MGIRVHIWVSGRVQGVSFRYYVREMANRLGVCGWVKNLPDGRVGAVLEGDESSVHEMTEFCRKGPRGAHVTDIEIKNERYTGESRSFRIEH
jgi:acylphosphatase